MTLTRMGLLCGVTLSCVGQAGLALPPQRSLCLEARRSILPRTFVHDRKRGAIVDGTSWQTRLPRADGEVATVVTDIRARTFDGKSAQVVRQDVGYNENQACWQRTKWSGLFECYAMSRGTTQSATTVTDPSTRAFLSVAVYLATGGAADAAARRVAAGKAFLVPMNGLYEAASAPNHIDKWYYCQSCGSPRAAARGRVSLAGIRFGRDRGATYFLTRQGVVAKLPDGARQAIYINCK